MQWINDEIRASQPWKLSIAEDMQQNPWLTKDTGAGGAGFTAQWDAAFVHTIRNAIIARDDNARDMNAVRDAIQGRFNGDAFQRVVYTENHDEDANGHQRVPEEIWPGNADSYYSRKRSTLGAILVFTSPAIPMIFQGQEFLQYGWFEVTARTLLIIRVSTFRLRTLQWTTCPSPGQSASVRIQASFCRSECCASRRARRYGQAKR